jgi:hypothetical protein
LTETNAHFEITDLSDLVRRRIEAAQCKAGDQIIILERGKASNASDSYSYRYLATDSFFAGPTRLQLQDARSHAIAAPR